MYYILETRFNGIDCNELDRVTYEICINTPNPKPMRRIYFEDGWYQESTMWSALVLGEYETLRKARKAIIEKLGNNMRLIVKSDNHNKESDVVEIIKPGKYTPLHFIDLPLWAEDIINKLSRDTTADEIDVIAEEVEKRVNTYGYTTTPYIAELLRSLACGNSLDDHSWLDLLVD